METPEAEGLGHDREVTRPSGSPRHVGHVLVCHMGSDTWRHLKHGTPRHCNRGHHEIANTNSNLVHFLLITKKLKMYFC